MPVPESPPETSVLHRYFWPKGIASLTIQLPEQFQSKRTTAHHVPPSRWKSTEFRIYYCWAVVALYLMCTVPMNLSDESHPNYHIYSRKLSKGWMFGRRVDNSDAQYRTFRNRIPALLLLIASYFLLSFSTKLFSRSRSQDRKPFFLLSTFLILNIFHGTSILKIGAIVTLNYEITKRLIRPGRFVKVGVAAVWIFNIGVLFANEIYDGYKFGALHSGLAFLDSLSGLQARWHISFNITMLRLVSFSLDYYWALTSPSNAPSTDKAVPLIDQPLPSPTQLVTLPLPLQHYTFTNYLIYALYPPLYIAGPIITFNTFTTQLLTPPSLPKPAILAYAIRFLACFLTMEWILHYMYVVAIKDSSISTASGRIAAWHNDTPFQLAMIGLWNLIIVWLKLLIPWRFFRLWAMLDGLDPPENMVRCVINNYSTLGFWRSWHRSYNLWTIRYIYIPIGGSKRAFLGLATVFTFVALWHDLSLKLLTWGWAISFFVLPEMVASRVVPESKFGGEWWYRHLCAAGGVVNVLLMLTANILGFVLGIDGTKYLLAQLFYTWRGLAFLVPACASIFIGVQFMMEYRASELRHGISRRC